MFTRPRDLPDSAVATALTDGWDLHTDEVAYAPVGFGSHHWRVTAVGERWFVTVDDLDARRRHLTDSREHTASRLTAALHTARVLRDAGHEFVIAPRLAVSGDVVHRVSDRYLAAVYEHVDGITHQYGEYESVAQRLEVLDRLVDLHAATPWVDDVALRDDFAIPGREQLSRALADTASTWGPGPFAADAAQLLCRYATDVATTLTRYDDLAAEVARAPDRFVITHGEPHQANTIDTTHGVVLVDWDSALLAPPERDLWMLIGDDPVIADEYAARTGVAVEPVVVQLYRLWWDLCEIALYIAEFRAPHIDSEDIRVAWKGLREHLDPTRWKS